MRGGSLCSGSGGLDLGLERTLGVEWVWHAEIDDAASKILDVRWPGVPNLGDFTTIEWEDVERVDLVAAGFPCFVAGTLILTRDGYRPIEALAVGDLVLTHEARWRAVTFCHETPDASVRRVCAPGVNLICTDEHPFYARRARYDAQRRRLGLNAPEWRDAADLKPDDFLGQTLPPVEAVESRSLAFWRLIGRYLADGWMVDRRGRKNGRVVISCANAELDELRALVSDAGYRAALERGESASKLHITRGDFYDFVRSFGRLAHGKTLPGFVHALDREESEAILAGYLDGDGYYDETGRCWRATTVSEQLAYGVALLAQRARGVVASVHPFERAGETEIEGRTVRQRPEWQVRIPFSNRSCVVEEDGYGWKKVKRNERLPDRVTVYNIAVEEDESYVANGAIVHNCPDYSVAGRRAGIDGEHGQVWYSVARCLRAVRPAVVVLENVDGIRTAKGPMDGAAGESALGVVLADLADLGYRWAYDRLRAADMGAPHGRLRWFCVAALPSAADALGGGVDADGRLPRRDQGAPGRRRSEPSAVPAGTEVDVAADALADGAGAATDAERRRREQHDEELGQLPVARAGDAPHRLLPTPTAGDGKASGSRNLEGSRAHPGVSLTDAVQTGDSTPRLLPTPQAADGDGGRQERGAMGRGGVRPSGQKATLPLPTAVSMRDELTATPFSIAADDQLVLLPTPVANPDNPGAGGELRAALVHGEGRRNETGTDTLGRPNEGRPRSPGLLPTPQAHDAYPGKTLEQRQAHRERTGGGAFNLNEVVEAEIPASSLLPTPTTQDAANTAGPSQRERHSDPLNVVATDLLPTPQTRNRKSRKAMTRSTENGRRSGGGNSSPPGLEQVVELADGVVPEDLPDYADLPPATKATVDGFGGDVQWGLYEAAVRRWETILGRPAPAPTDEKGRLAPEFVEWMLGYPYGWFDVPGVSRTRKLRALGNSVQVQCAEAVGYWTRGLIESGLLLSVP